MVCEGEKVALPEGFVRFPVPGMIPRYRHPTNRATAAGSSSLRWIEFSSASMKLPVKALWK